MKKKYVAEEEVKKHGANHEEKGSQGKAEEGDGENLARESETTRSAQLFHQEKGSAHQRLAPTKEEEEEEVHEEEEEEVYQEEGQMGDR